MKVIKRNGQYVDYDKTKIFNAVSKANNESKINNEKHIDEILIDYISDKVTERVTSFNRNVSVEEIQDIVERTISDLGFYDVSKRYIKYRYKRELLRENNPIDNEVLTLIDESNEEIKQENSNKKATLAPTQRDYIAGIVSKSLTNRLFLDSDIVEAHNKGLIHFHDSDYFVQKICNCSLINLEDMLQNGTVISGTLIEKPKSFSTACTIATQIIAQVASNCYGGQTISFTHLAPFVDVSRQNIIKTLKEEIDGVNISKERFYNIVENRVKAEIKKGVKTIQYQVNTLNTSNGQTPFITLFMYLNEAKDEATKNDLALIIEEVIRQRYKGVKNEKGVWITPAFPKLIYVLEEDNIKPDGKYYYLTELSAKCTAKRLVPDYISEKKMIEYKGYCFPNMSCRSFLSPYYDENDNIKFYGRFNKGVVTINLPHVALSSKKNENKFWKIFDERLELCHKALLTRYKRLKGTKSDISPILWQYGAWARLKKGEIIDKYLTGGYSSISLGYAGLYECVKYMTGNSHTDPESKKFAIKIMKYMNKKCDEWNNEINLGFSLYGTPIEATTYKFAKANQRDFGIIDGVTDKNYITNSYHIPVTEKINVFDKFKTESEFQKLSLGGCISYAEIPNMNHNIEAVIEIIKFIYDNIMYAELNTKSDYCHVCGYDGEIKIVKENNDLIWECPNCKNRDTEKMNVARRTCGYIGSNFWNYGRTQEISERVIHVDIE